MSAVAQGRAIKEGWREGWGRGPGRVSMLGDASHIGPLRLDEGYCVATVDLHGIERCSIRGPPVS